MGAWEGTVEGIGAADWPALVAWLDDGLRRGLRGTLQREYPLSLQLRHADRHRVARRDGHVAAHAMFQPVTVRTERAALAIGLIGLVYTDPSARGLGLASRCVEACVEALQREGCALAVLWSDQPGFYARLGFRPVGRETLLVADASCLARAARATGAEQLAVRAARPGDLPYLEGLYARKPIHVERPPRALETLAAGPDVELRVAERNGLPIAYAALGRGDDFRDVVHEWAGETPGVIACLAALRGERPAVGVLSSPTLEPPSVALLRAGALPQPRPFGLARLLDARALLRAAIAGDGELAGLDATQDGDRVTWETARGATTLSTGECLAILLGAGGPDEPAAGVAPDGLEALATCLGPAERTALAKRLPWPLYVWGFDSI